MVPATFGPIKQLRSQHITTWWIRRLCSYMRSSTSCFRICDLINICWIAVKYHQIFSKLCGFSKVTQRIFVRSQIWQREVKERLNLHNVRTDHVMEWSELKYIIGAKSVSLKCRVFSGKTVPFPMEQVFGVVRPVAMVQFRVEPDMEPSRKFGPIADTRYTWQLLLLLIVWNCWIPWIRFVFSSMYLWIYIVIHINMYQYYTCSIWTGCSWCLSMNEGIIVWRWHSCIHRDVHQMVYLYELRDTLGRYNWVNLEMHFGGHYLVNSIIHLNPLFEWVGNTQVECDCVNIEMYFGGYY